MNIQKSILCSKHTGYIAFPNVANALNASSCRPIELASTAVSNTFSFILLPSDASEQLGYLCSLHIDAFSSSHVRVWHGTFAVSFLQSEFRSQLRTVWYREPTGFGTQELREAMVVVMQGSSRPCTQRSKTDGAAGLARTTPSTVAMILGMK